MLRYLPCFILARLPQKHDDSEVHAAFLDILEQKRNDRLQPSKRSGIRKKLNIVAGKSVSEGDILTLKAIKNTV